jgi:hypothetical protein
MPIGTLYNQNNVVVGQAAVLVAPANTPLPTPLTSLIAADPFSLTPWQTGTAPYAWNQVGATDQGWKYGTNKSSTDIMIEEQSTPAAEAINSQKVTIEGSLSEDVSTTLTLAYNGVKTTTAPGASTIGYDTIVLTDTVLYYAVALLTAAVGALPRVIYAPQWSQLSNVSTDFRRASAKRMYPVAFSTVCQPGQIQVINVTAAHT